MMHILWFLLQISSEISCVHIRVGLIEHCSQTFKYSKWHKIVKLLPIIHSFNGSISFSLIHFVFSFFSVYGIFAPLATHRQWIKSAEMIHTAHQITRNGFTALIHWQPLPILVSFQNT